MPRRWLPPLIWVVVTTAAIGLAWLAVSSAIADTTEQVAPRFPATATVPPATPATTATTAATAATSQASSVAPASSAPPASSSAPVVDPPQTMTATFPTNGGVVTASCTGADIALVSASPQAGYTVEVKDTGPAEVRVRFRGSGDFEVRAVCQGGVPVNRG